MVPRKFNSEHTLKNKIQGGDQFSQKFQTVVLARKKREHVSVDVLYSLLQYCVLNRDYQAGQDVLCLIRSCGFQSDSFLGSHVIRMLALFGKLQEANSTFSRLSEPTIYAWSAIIFANAVLGDHQRALNLYQNMNQQGFRPDGHTFVAILKACVTECDQNIGPLTNTYVGSCLIDMYVKCGHLDDARNVFAVLCKQDATVWNAMISGYTHHSQTHCAIQLYAQMLQEGVGINQITLSCILKACADMRTINEGKYIHALSIFKDFETDSFVSNNLVNLYARCGDLENARKAFERIHRRNVVTWTALIGCYAEHGEQQMAFHCFEKMKEEGILPNHITFVSVLKACSIMVDLKLIHSYIVEYGFDSYVVIVNNLIKLYASLKSFTDACELFYKTQEQDIGSWNFLISEYAQHGQLETALWLFHRMQQEKMRPDNVTWSAVISGYIQYGYGLEALDLFQQMIKQDIKPDVVAFVCALKACSMVISLEMGKLVYGMIAESCIEHETDVCEALLIMYMTCGNVEEAQKIFDRLDVRSTRMWNAMITRYEQIADENETSGFASLTVQDINIKAKIDLLKNDIPEFSSSQRNNDIIQLYCKMKRESVEPDRITFIYVLRACSRVVTLSQGKLIYADIIECDMGKDILICNLIIDLFLSFASFKDAYGVFTKLKKRNVVTYNTILAACARFGNSELAEGCFRAMEEEGVLTDDVTFLCILSAFSHFGKTDEVICYFNSMRDGYGVLPAFVHYTCIADHLARMGLLKEGEDMLQTMPFQPNIVGWTSLMSHCKVHGCVDIASQCIY